MSAASANSGRPWKFWSGLAITNIAALAIFGYWTYNRIVIETADRIKDEALVIIEEKLSQMDSEVKDVKTASRAMRQLIAEDVRLFKDTTFDSIIQLARAEDKLREATAQMGDAANEATRLKKEVNSITKVIEDHALAELITTFDDRLRAFEAPSIVGTWFETSRVVDDSPIILDDNYFVLSFCENSVTLKYQEGDARLDQGHNNIDYTYKDSRLIIMDPFTWPQAMKVTFVGRDTMTISGLISVTKQSTFRRHSEDSHR